MVKRKGKSFLRKTWYFIWEDNSIWSWFVNIILAFVLIKFIVYPGLGLLLNTSFPVVAVVSSSMEHKSLLSCTDKSCNEFEHVMCGNSFEEKVGFSLDDFWDSCGGWYMENTEIEKEDFSEFPFKNGFNKGDIMVLVGDDVEDIAVGDVIVFKSNRKEPIIHRIVNKFDDDDEIIFQTKGDNNKDSIKNIALDETDIGEERIIGKAVVRIPFLGYIKIWFVDFLRFIGMNI